MGGERMTVVLVDGPEGVGKTGVSKFLSEELGCPRLEMMEGEPDYNNVEAQSEVFNDTLVQLDKQGVDVVVDRGPYSSLVYSELYDRGTPTHAERCIHHVNPIVVYLRCDAIELRIRYEDDFVDWQDYKELVRLYDDIVGGNADFTIDTGTGLHEKLDEITGML